MSSITPATLVDQRHMLQRQLQTQREVIAQQLGPTTEVIGDYPRSLTMRFLVRRSPLLSRLAWEAATLLIGSRLVKSISAAMVDSKITRPD